MDIKKKRSASRTPQPRSRRPALNTYYRAEPKSAQSPFIKKTPKKPVRKFLFGFLDLIVLAALIMAVIYALALKANPIIDANAYPYHSRAAYASAARVQFSRLKNRNKITFDESSVAQSLQKQFPEISAIQVELPVFSERPVLHLTIAKPSFVLDSPGSALLVDSAGVAVGPAASFKTAGLPAVNDKSGYIAKTGNQVVSSSAVGFIDTLVAQCRHAKVPIASMSLPPAPQELQLRTKDTSYYVKFYLGGDPLVEAGQFLAARQRFSQTHHGPSQYLDVRVSGKIFYK